MDLKEAMTCRHSVRRYTDKPLTTEAIATLRAKIDETNAKTGLHIQLVTEEPRAFTGLLSYGKFKGVRNYIVMAGPHTPGLDMKVGYYGEELVLLAQTLGLNTCWVGMTYRNVEGAYEIRKDEKLACVIALGYGESQGGAHKIKHAEQVSNVSADTPEWFRQGVEAALLAPTAINQQKFRFEYQPATNGKARVSTLPGFSIFGYTKMDLGIARLHFELGAGTENFEFAEEIE
jgi:nitroreductase